MPTFLKTDPGFVFLQISRIQGKNVGSSSLFFVQIRIESSVPRLELVMIFKIQSTRSEFGLKADPKHCFKGKFVSGLKM